MTREAAAQSESSYRAAAWQPDTSGSDHSGVYLRFGHWPDDERSFSPAGGYHEDGVSAYDLDRDGDPAISHGLDRGHEHDEHCDGDCHLQEDNPDNDPQEEMQGRARKAERNRHYGDDKPDQTGHLVRGRMTGTGYDGEPLLRNVRRVGDWIDHRHLFIPTAHAHRLARDPSDEDYEPPEETPPGHHLAAWHDDEEEDPDRYVTCGQGHEHWGALGAAGLLIRHKGEDGKHRYLLQERSPHVQHGGTWSTPGGALQHGESPEEGAVREASEEGMRLPRDLVHHHTFTDDHGGWAYHTVVMDSPRRFNPEGEGESDWESEGHRWVTPQEAGKLPLHPGFAASWDKVRKSGAVVKTADKREEGRTAVRAGEPGTDHGLPENASKLGIVYHSTPYKTGFPHDDWMHVGTRAAAEDRASAIHPKDFGLPDDTPVYMHSMRLRGRVYPKVISDDFANDMAGSGYTDEVDEGWPSGRGYHVFPYNNRSEGPAQLSYLVHKSAIVPQEREEYKRPPTNPAYHNIGYENRWAREHLHVLQGDEVRKSGAVVKTAAPGYEVRFDPDYHGHHRVSAWPPGVAEWSPGTGYAEPLGSMQWHPQTGEVSQLHVRQVRQGIGTALWRRATEEAGRNGLAVPVHSTSRTPAADAWAHSVGGEIPPLQEGCRDPGWIGGLEDDAQFRPRTAGNREDQLAEMDPRTRATALAQEEVRLHHPKLTLPLREKNGQSSAVLSSWLRDAGHPRADEAYVAENRNAGVMQSSTARGRNGEPVVALHPDRWDYGTLAHEAAHLIRDQKTGRKFGEPHGPEGAHDPQWAATYAGLLNGISKGSAGHFISLYRQHSPRQDPAGQRPDPRYTPRRADAPAPGMAYLSVPHGTLHALPQGMQSRPGAGTGEHHVTVAHLPRGMSDEEYGNVLEHARKAAAASPPLEGTLGGMATFPHGAGPETRRVAYVPASIPGVERLHADLAGVNTSPHPEFRPHVSVAYLRKGEENPDSHPEVPVRFTHLHVERNGEVTKIPLTGPIRAGASIRHAKAKMPDYAEKFVPEDEHGLHSIEYRTPEDELLGYISWHPESGTVDDVRVDRRYRRNGIATRLWDQAREMTPHLRHDEDDEMTDDGRAWAAAVDRRPGMQREAAAEEEPEAYYHVSYARFPRGHMLTPQGAGRANFPGQSSGEHVYMTGDRDHAETYRYHLWEQGYPEQHLYEVHPHGPVEDDPEDERAVRTRHPVEVTWHENADDDENDWFHHREAVSGYDGLTGRSGMIYLELPPGAVRPVPGGVDDSHVTLVYLGKNVSDKAFAEACRRTKAAAARHAPMDGVLRGIDIFPPSKSSDGKVPAFVPAYVGGVGALRRELEDLSASEHTDYRPHVTLAYLEEGDSLPAPHPAVPLRFTRVYVKRGDDVVSFPLTGGASG